MNKPKGGRGHKAPYETKLMRVPEPLASQVEALCQCYQDFLAGGGDSNAPPCFLLERSKAAAAECPTTDSSSAQPIVLDDNPPEPKSAEPAPEPTFKTGDRVLVISKKSQYQGKYGEITWIDGGKTKKGKYAVNLDKERRRKTVDSGFFAASEIALIGDSSL